MLAALEDLGLRKARLDALDVLRFGVAGLDGRLVETL